MSILREGSQHEVSSSYMRGEYIEEQSTRSSVSFMTDCSPTIFFRVITAIRCPGYLQYKRGALKKALTERYLSHSSLMFSAVRTKLPAMRRSRTVITDGAQRTEGHQLLARVAGRLGQAAMTPACLTALTYRALSIALLRSFVHVGFRRSSLSSLCTPGV